MAICPKCKKEIGYLVNWQSGENRYDYNGEDYEHQDFIPNDATNDYECPECNEVLFKGEDSARKFLKGK